MRLLKTKYNIGDTVCFRTNDGVVVSRIKRIAAFGMQNIVYNGIYSEDQIINYDDACEYLGQLYNSRKNRKYTE